MTDLLNRVGRSAFSYLSGEGGGVDAGFVGSIVEVDGLRVQVTRQLGEGGCAIIYAAKDVASGQEYALKRFLVIDESTIKTVVTEIKLLKDLKNQPDTVDFMTAASIDHTEGRKMKEFLLLMELCPRGDVAKLLQTSREPLSPLNVCVAMGGLCRALQALHSRTTPVVHRDIKLENMLVDSLNHVKLCDFGSCTTTTHYPNQDWNANQRNMLEDELAKHSTPMYRAPEMLDTWSNFPVNTKVDMWAAGCVLFCLCYNKHPFEDSNKLAIVNGNYRIPANDSRYVMYNNLIKRLLTLDPTLRPNAMQVLEELSVIAESNNFKTKGPLDLPDFAPPAAPSLALPASRSLPSTPDEAGRGVVGGGMSAPNINSIKGAAGSIFSRLKDTTKNVVASVQQSMTTRELDFHCITSRVAAMSFPADGLESAYRNHIDDVRNMMESQHGGHYTVYNLAERSYPPSKYPNGNLLNYPWSVGTVPALDYLLDILANILEYLARDVRNVVVVHCLDGKSSTALVVCGLLLYCSFVSTVEQAVAVFSNKRTEPTMTHSQMYYLKHLASLVRSSPPVLKSPFLTITNLVMEPVPLFNKAGEGCTPYVEIYQDKAKTISTIQDYNRMKGYSVIAGDEGASIPVNVTVCADVTVSVFHARQALTKTTGIKICQFQFHTNSLTPGRPCNVWKLDQLDFITEPQRYADNFRIVLNCDTSEECSGKNVTWPLPESAQLLFNSEQDYEATSRLLTNTQNKFLDNNPGFGKPLSGDVSAVLSSIKPAPAKATTAAANKPKPATAVDLLGLNESAESNGEPDQSPTDTDADLLSGFNAQSSTETPATPEGFDFLSDFSRPAENMAPEAGVADLLGGVSLGGTSIGGEGLLGGASIDGSKFLGGGASLGGGGLLDIGDPIDLQTSSQIPRDFSSPNLGNQANDPFANFSSIPSSFSNQDLFGKQPMNAGRFGGPMGAQGSSQPMGAQGSSQPMGAQGSSQPMGAQGSWASSQMNSQFGARTQGAHNHTKPANSILDFDVFGGQSVPGMNNNLKGSNSNLMGGSTSTSQPGKSAGAAPKVAQPMGPNYSRSFFTPQQAQPSSTGGVKPKVSTSTFDDLLGGFNPTNREAGGGKTIGAMKKAEVTKTMDPDDLKIFDWKEGKERNIRTLLSSLHKIIWDGARWQECNMSQLVGPGDVKKMYRKACLAVHPDKQMGKENENLSKLIFMELNEAWSEFENDPQQQNVFG